MTEQTTARVLLYSDDRTTREQVRLTLGRRLASDLPELEVFEVATQPVVLQTMDAGGIDLVILDGEATPSGGIGLCHQLKNEIKDCPPVLLLVARAADAWLATWSEADAITPFPVDPVRLPAAAADLLRARLAERGNRVTFTWTGLLADLVRGRDLAPEAAAWAMDQVLAGEVTPVQIAGFAIALRVKGETVRELTGLADAMLSRATPIALNPEAVDVVGSGGDRANTVNVSTMAAIVAAACGVPVVKHGNRAASSACGTADCLEALGVVIDVPPPAQAAVLAEAGIVFLFAPLYHPALRFASSARRELGVPTAFNFLGPLANPARPHAQAVGVADVRMAPLMAGVIAARGNRGLVFHGEDGLDELTTTGPSAVWLIGDGQVVESRLDPAELGVTPVAREDLVGGDPAHNAAVVRDVLGGRPGAVRDIVALNAAAAQLAFAGPDLHAPLAVQLAAPLERAYAAIDSGAAATLLDTWVRVTRAAKPA